MDKGYYTKVHFLVEWLNNWWVASVYFHHIIKSMHLKTVVAKASNIVKFVRKSVNASEILEGEKKLQASNATLWNSQLYMIKSILNVPEENWTKLNANSSGSVVECLTRDRRAVGSSLTGVTALWSLSKIH